ncbi:MAG: ABC transporter ATP-binding protein [Lachnospiraceae bacterium]|nr:ABC transporter ATP-binding protein [Lachnospiraceae bacterium]
MKTTVMKAQDVCKSFANNGGQNHVLDMVNLEIYDGDFTVIMGSSGAGKSTLLYALSGMDKPTSGSVCYKEREISHLKEQKMAQLRAKEFGFVFQQAHLVSNLTLFENVAVTGYLTKTRTQKEVRSRAEELLSQMHVEKAADRLPSQVSGGEAQRAAIARAMMNEPGMLFADEPTGALNKRNTQEVLDLLTKINEDGQNILMVTHDIKAAIRATRLLYLEDGRVVDEMSLPVYEKEEARRREKQVEAWLSSMEW